MGKPEVTTRGGSRRGFAAGTALLAGVGLVGMLHAAFVSESDIGAVQAPTSTLVQQFSADVQLPKPPTHSAISADGRVAFFVVGGENGRAATLAIYRWEQGLGLAHLTDSLPAAVEASSVALLTPLTVSSDGRTLGLAVESSTGRNLLVWQEGIGFRSAPLPRLADPITLSLASTGERLLLSGGAKNGSGEVFVLSLAAPPQQPEPVLRLEPLASLPKGVTTVGGEAGLTTISSRDENVTLATWGLRLPVNGYDIDQDGGTDLLTFYRDAESTVFRGYLLSGARGVVPQSPASLVSMVAWRFGESRSLPAPGDYNGDGTLDLAVFIPGATETWEGKRHNWHIAFGSPTGGVLGRFPESITPWSLSWGWAENGAIPVPADYDGDGRTDIALYGPTTGRWHLLLSREGFHVAAAQAEKASGGIVIRHG
ncbi:MAG: VCBS repeat-containing protein, partial [Bdellovibrionales bacterium]|nr:VCBS repeat-containing protein [Bdellovibrionales bacterium]